MDKEILITSILQYVASDEFKNKEYWNEIGQDIAKIVNAFYEKQSSKSIELDEAIKLLKRCEIYFRNNSPYYFELQNDVEDFLDKLNEQSG